MSPDEVKKISLILKTSIEKDHEENAREAGLLLLTGMALNLARLVEAKTADTPDPSAF